MKFTLERLSAIASGRIRPEVIAHPVKRNSTKRMRVISSAVSAGQPLPPDDYLGEEVDMNDFFAKHPEEVLVIKVQGERMTYAGIDSGDTLIVDKSKVTSHLSNCVAVVRLNGDYTVKRIVREKSKVMLIPANPKFKKIEVGKDSNFEVIGVVTKVIKNIR